MLARGTGREFDASFGAGAECASSFVTSGLGEAAD
jgi:hypothetical protein